MTPSSTRQTTLKLAVSLLRQGALSTRLTIGFLTFILNRRRLAMTKNINPFEILPKLALGSTQLVNAAGITSRQLRYWESQGYIQSLPEKANNARQYSLSTALNVMAIKQGLDTGLPLATAVANTKTIINQSNYLGRLINETYQGYQATTDQVRLNFGPVADQPDQQVTGVLTANDAYFKLTHRGQ